MRKVAWGLLGWASVVGCGSDLSTSVPGATEGASSDDSAGEEAPAPITSPKVGVTQATRVLSGAGAVVTETAAINVPEGALGEATELTVAEVNVESIVAELPSVLTPVAPPTAFTPHGTSFAVPITLSLFYEAPPGAALTVLRLDDENDTTWERVPAEFKDGVAFFQTTHFSIYSVTACDPADDPAGLCSDVTSGETPIGSLPPEDLKPFERFPDAGVLPPAEEKSDAGETPTTDAGELDAGFDGGVAPPSDDELEDGGPEPAKDVDASTHDAGSAPDKDAGDVGDAGPDPHEVGCDWIERCTERVGCDSGRADGSLEPVGADGLCPEGSKLVREQSCTAVPVCTAAYCELHPDVCGGDAGAPPLFDGGVAPDADGGEPRCGWETKCGVRAVCPAELADAALADAGKCTVSERCEVPQCDLPTVCEDLCKDVQRCDATGAVCTTETVCRQLCTPNPECPPPVCTEDEVCEPTSGCTAAELVHEEYCEEVYVCTGSDADAGTVLDGGPSADGATSDPCARLAECLAVAPKCEGVSDVVSCLECGAIVQRCAK